MRYRALIRRTGLLFLLLVPALTAAADDKWVAATAFCHGADPAARDALLYHPSGVIAGTASTVTVLCPIMRDNSTAKPTEVALRVKNGVGGATISCDLSSWLGPTSVETFTKVTSSGAGERTLVWSGGDVPDHPGGEGHYVIQCTMPNNGTLYALGWAEP